MKPKFMLAAAMVVGCQAIASATSPLNEHIDSLKQNHNVVQFGNGETLSSDSIRRVIGKFYEDQFRHSLEPDAPYFLFLSKDSNLAMGIGGNLAIRGWYDWGGFVPTNGFVTSEIPMVPDPANMRQLRGNVSSSNIFFRVLGNNKKIGNYQVYISAKFNGGSNGRLFKLNKAYATFNDWTVGYANSTFEDPATIPFTIDSEGPNSAISDTDILVRWMHKFKKHHVVAASLEMPNADDAPGNNFCQGSTGYLPNVAGFYQYQWGHGQHVRLSGIMRFLAYRDMVAQSSHTRLGWGVKASSVFTPADGPVTVYLGGYYGKGIAGITNDLGGANLDLLANPESEGKMYAPGVFGCYGGLQYNFTPSVFASASVSELRFLPGHEVDPSTYRYGLYGAFNVCWYVTPRVLVGAEVNLGALKDFSMQREWAHRAGLLAQFSF